MTGGPLGRSRVLIVAGAMVGLWLVAWKAPASSAVVRERNVSIQIGDDGTLSEHTRLAVFLENADDVASWSTYRVVLDDNRTLEALEAVVVDGSGHRRPIASSDRKIHEYAGASIFHSSRRHLLVRYPTLAIGQTLEIEQSVAYRPYFPASTVALGTGARTDRLDVSVTGGDDSWRWRLDGPGAGLRTEEIPGGVRIVGENLPPAVDVPLARMRPGPVLRFGWGRVGTWADVGDWYRSLLDALPRDREVIARQARSLVAGIESPAERLAALTRFVQDKVRYVAVEVGAGGYQPAPAGETLARRWGDCKDKSLLLADLLSAAGIEAHPALLRAGGRAVLDEAFPSPDQFNHMIVAVPDGDGYTFVDSTQRRGGVAWLHPQAQDRAILVVRPERAVVARTPLRAAEERRSLAVTLTVDARGDATGHVDLTLRGKPADTLMADLLGAADAESDDTVRSLFESLLPGVNVRSVTWNAESDGAPTLNVSAMLTWPGLVQGLATSRASLTLPGMRVTPDPVVLEARTDGVLLPVRAADVSWNLTLPEDWCLGASRDRQVDNLVGQFEQRVEVEASRLLVTRNAEVRRRHVDTASLPQLSALALEEHRAHRRRIRLVACEAN